jgi:hypothetical protein
MHFACLCCWEFTDRERLIEMMDRFRVPQITLCLRGLRGDLERRARIAPRRIGPFGRATLVLLAYGFLSVILTWPLAAQLATHVPAGIGGDTWVHQWTFWWLKRCVSQGLNPFYTDLLFYPGGVSLTAHNIGWVSFALWLPLQALFGNYVAYGLMYIGLFAFNGFAMYLLAREWTGSPPAAFVGGLVYGSWPYVLSRSGQPNWIAILWLPLALLYLRRTIEKRRKRDAAWLALFVALTGISCWQLLILAGVTLVPYLLYKGLTDAACRTRRTVALLALAGLLSVVLMAPLATPVIIGQLTRAHPDDVLIDHSVKKNTDLLAYLLPNSNLYLWGHVVPLLGENLQFTNDRVEFIGYTTLLLALYGAVKHWSKTRFWVLVAVLHMVLALGPQLRVGSRLYPQVPMPYRLIEDLFFVRILRNPDRFNVYLGLPVGMLVAWGVKALLCQRFLGRKIGLILGIAGALILGEACLVPYRIERPVTPEWYYELAEESGRFAVLDMPMHTRKYDKWYMLYQMTHGKPLVQGHVSRNSREEFAFLESTPFLKRLHQENVMDPTCVDVTHQLQTLAQAGVRYLILHKGFALPQQLADWQDWLTFEPYYQDADVVVYRTQPHVGQDIAIAQQITDEIGLIRATFSPEELTPAGIIQTDVRWASRGAPGREYDACLGLVDALGQVAQSDCQPVLPARPTSYWETHEVARGDYKLRVNPLIVGGTYTLTLSLVEHATNIQAGQAVGLGAVQVKALPWTYDRSGQAYPSYARWGQAILLPTYDVQQDSAESLRLTLYWQALREMDVSYKVFVHLVDQRTGAIVVQDDAVPRRWTYPTTLWEPGEVVADTVVLSLAGVSKGRYLVQVGLYDPANAERLPAYSSQGRQYPDNAVPLTVVVR